MDYRLYLFDFDYTLVNSEPAIVKCFHITLQKLGYPDVPDERIKKTIGLPMVEAVKRIIGTADTAEAEHFVDAYRPEADRYMTPGTTFFPGAVETLRAIKATGAKVGIISNKTHRAFKAYLVWDAQAGKVAFAFEPRGDGSSAPRRGAAARTPAKTAGAKPAAKTGAKAPGKTTAKAAAKPATPKKPRAATTGTLTPSPALAAVIGDAPTSRPQAIKKLWEYIKAHNLQDPKDKRTIVADDTLRAVLGADSIGMFKLAGIVGQHVS